MRQDPRDRDAAVALQHPVVVVLAQPKAGMEARVTRRPAAMPPVLIAKARGELLEGIQERPVHAHLRRHTSVNQPDALVWHLIFRKTLICGTDRCVTMWLVEE